LTEHKVITRLKNQTKKQQNLVDQKILTRFCYFKMEFHRKQKIYKYQV